jgi:hypothetical protein
MSVVARHTISLIDFQVEIAVEETSSGSDLTLRVFTRENVESSVLFSTEERTFRRHRKLVKSSMGWKMKKIARLLKISFTRMKLESTGKGKDK